MNTGDVLKSYWEKYPNAKSETGGIGRGRPEIPHKTYNAFEEKTINLTPAQKAQNEHAERAQADHDEIVKLSQAKTRTASTKTTLKGVKKTRKPKPFFTPLPGNQTRGVEVTPTLQGHKYANAVEKAHRLVSNVVANIRGTNDPIVHVLLDAPIEGDEHFRSIQDHLDEAKGHHGEGLAKLAAGGATQHESSTHFIDATESLEKAVAAIKNLHTYVKDHISTNHINAETPDAAMATLAEARSTARTVKPSARHELQFGGQRIKPNEIDEKIDLEKAREMPTIMERINATTEETPRTLAKDIGQPKAEPKTRRGRADRRPVGSGKKVGFGKGTSGNNIANEGQPVPTARELTMRGASYTGAVTDGLPGPSMPGRTPRFDATSAIPGDVPAAPSAGRNSIFTGASSSARGDAAPAAPVAEPKPGKGKGKK